MVGVLLCTGAAPWPGGGHAGLHAQRHGNVVASPVPAFFAACQYLAHQLFAKAALACPLGNADAGMAKHCFGLGVVKWFGHMGGGAKCGYGLVLVRKRFYAG